MIGACRCACCMQPVVALKSPPPAPSSFHPHRLPPLTTVGIARAKMKGFLQNSHGSREYEGSGGDEGATENPMAGLASHADGLESGGTPSSSSSSHGNKGPLPVPGPSGAGCEGMQRQAPIPNYSQREEHVVALSKRLLHIFYFCGTIFAGMYLVYVGPLIDSTRDFH